VIVERVARAANVKTPQSSGKEIRSPRFMFGHTGGDRIRDVLIAWNEPDRRSDSKIGPKISSCIR
jgi:hypothetical protein